jgi:opacity protein-like surface antigen
MKMKHALSAAFGALALGLVATTAQAAPIATLSGATDGTSVDAGLVQKATWYGRHRDYDYGYDYYDKPFFGYNYGYRYRFYRPFRYGFHNRYRFHRHYGGFGYGRRY